MDNFVEELKKYFENTSKEKVLEDWEKSKEFDKVGPTVEEFLDKMKIDKNFIIEELQKEARGLKPSIKESEFLKGYHAALLNIIFSIKLDYIL